MRKVVFFMAALAAASVFAQTLGPTRAAAAQSNGKRVITPEMLAARDLRVLKKTGGFIDVPGKGPLPVIVDARAKRGAAADEFARLYRLAMKMDIVVKAEPRGEAKPIEFARRVVMEGKDVLLAVVLVDGDPLLPALSVFPEERIGIVNAERLKGGEDPTRREVRVTKEAFRAFGFMTGMGFSQMAKDIMQPIFTVDELDANDYPFIQPMNMAKAQRMYQHFGVVRPRHVPYRVAVKEGWASAPTNDYQKAVWEEEKNAKQDAKDSTARWKRDFGGTNAVPPAVKK